MASRLDRIIEEALADAGVGTREHVKAAKVAKINLTTDAVEKLASALENVAQLMSTTLQKQAYEVDKSQEADFNENLRELFLGQDTNEDTLKKREWIKRRIEQLGGVSAPSA